MDPKYYYSNANHVRSDNSPGWEPCFGGKYNCKWYELLPVMSEEDCVKWLNLLKEEWDFNWQWSEYGGERTLRIYPPQSDKNFLIIFGNLTKGVSEYAFFCEKHLKDDSDAPFFVKSWKAFKSFDKMEKLEVGYNASHGWFKYDDALKDSYSRKAKTLKDLVKNFTEKKPQWPYVWETSL